MATAVVFKDPPPSLLPPPCLPPSPTSQPTITSILTLTPQHTDVPAEPSGSGDHLAQTSAATGVWEVGREGGRGLPEPPPSPSFAKAQLKSPPPPSPFFSPSPPSSPSLPSSFSSRPKQNREGESGGGDKATSPTCRSRDLSHTLPTGSRPRCWQEGGAAAATLSRLQGPPKHPVKRLKHCLKVWLHHAHARWLGSRGHAQGLGRFSSLRKDGDDPLATLGDGGSSSSAISLDKTLSSANFVDHKFSSTVFVAGDTSSSAVFVEDASSSAVVVKDASSPAIFGHRVNDGRLKDSGYIVDHVGDKQNADTDRLVTEEKEEEEEDEEEKGSRGGGRGYCPHLPEGCRRRMSHVTVVSLIWAVLSLVVAGACAVSWVHPIWVRHPDRLHSFGLFRQCAPAPSTSSTPSSSPRVLCGGYGPGGSVEVGGIPSGAWQLSTLLYGVGVGLQGIGGVMAVIVLLLPSSHPPHQHLTHHHHHHYHHHHHQHQCRRYSGAGLLALWCGYLQTLAVLLLLAGLLTFPLGFSTGQFRYYCGSEGVYCLGHCDMGWGYVLAITATALAIFCPVLSNYIDLALHDQEEEEGEDRDGEGEGVEEGGTKGERENGRTTDV